MINPAFLKELDIFLDQYYEQSKKTGRYLSICFPGKGGKNQVRNFENIVYTARRISAIQNFIKNQMGKESSERQTWTKIPSESTMSMGDFLLFQLEELIQKAKSLSENDLGLNMEFGLYLARIWAKQVASEYLYQIIRGGADGKD